MSAQLVCYSSKMRFTEKVYTLIRKIPVGKVATYGQVAALVGSPRAARAVGLAMKTNPDAPRTPCHRVVASDGSLHGYSGGEGLPTKRLLLQKEGVIFQGAKVDLAKSLWNPKLLPKM